MKGSHIVIPASLRAKTLDTLHNSHMGETKTIEHARTVLFWPKMQNNIIAHLSSCCPCAKFKIKQKPEPLSCKVIEVVTLGSPSVVVCSENYSKSLNAF